MVVTVGVVVGAAEVEVKPAGLELQLYEVATAGVLRLSNTLLHAEVAVATPLAVAVATAGVTVMVTLLEEALLGPVKHVTTQV